MILSNIISKEKVNSGRQIEFDLLRGITLIFIIICHVGLELGEEGTWFYYFSDIIGSETAAPVFTILLGMCVLFSKKQYALHYLRRGICLIILGQFLNIARGYPFFFVGNIDYFSCVRGLFVVDILTFAGFTFLLFALFKALKIPSFGVFIISVIFLIIGNILIIIPNCLDFSGAVSIILSYFLPLNNDWCCFNLLTWFVFPSFGLMLGEIVIRCKDKDKFYLILLIIGLFGVIMLYGNIIILFPNYNLMYAGENYYRMGVLNSFVAILLFLFCIGFWHFIAKILPNFIKKYLTFLSTNVTVVFIFSWIFITSLYHYICLIGITLSVVYLNLFLILVLIISSLLTLLYLKIKGKKCNKLKSSK